MLHSIPILTQTKIKSATLQRSCLSTIILLKNYNLFYISIVFFLGQSHYTYDFSYDFSFYVMLIIYSKNNRICCHGHDLVTTSGEPTRIHHSETTIQWSSLRYDHALKPHPNVQVHINYRCISGVLTFAKFAKFLKRSTLTISLNVFSYFPAWT